MPRRPRPFRLGIRLQLAIGWWRIRMRFPPRAVGSWRFWLWLLVFGMPFGYVLSLPIVVYLFERLNLGGGVVERVLEFYYLPLIWLMQVWPGLESFMEWSVEVLEFCFGEM
jgi:hypothetical protein